MKLVIKLDLPEDVVRLVPVLDDLRQAIADGITQMVIPGDDGETIGTMTVEQDMEEFYDDDAT